MNHPLITSDAASYFPFGFPLSRSAWDEYGIDDVVAATPEATQAPIVYTMRALASRMNEHRDFSVPGTEPVHAGQLLASGLLTEVLRFIATTYCADDHPGVLGQALDNVRVTQGSNTVVQPIDAFVSLYPPGPVRTAQCTQSEYLRADSDGIPNSEGATRELLLLRLSVLNRALRPCLELFDDVHLKRRAPYERLVAALAAHFRTQPPVDDTGQNLFDFLRSPALACPDSLEDQLDYITENWAYLLPPDLLERLRLVAGIVREETLMRGHGPGPLEVMRFGPDHLLDWGYPEPAAFTHDRDWMSNVVLIAKSVYVWLDQLSKHYRRSITRLDQIPGEELDRLARWGFTGLWLIGVWERSAASQRIKQIMGNPEALASAYSLYDYVVAGNLGGPEALGRLRERAWQRGIRLASDMVPNHVGLYSRWVIEHPDWFIQLSYPPYPGYQFTGENLSRDPTIGLFIEDGYWHHGDAAVVFKRVDNRTGDTRYIYHGNDGTNMPWNDTAQLNFLIPEAREAVIQCVLHVARQFPILRFDAAMTLAKKHYQRLWFPKPGDAGAVPSRAEHGMTRPEFDEVFPREFWREVVDRIQAEVPDTLLIAEAFWLMEGYFVRTLGMHRVYNSAFMNMLKMEENAKYRATIRNVLEFSPEVLKRFVNFMNNPDERTAIEQFGKEDKYFGVAALMVTMPGLPMFGHGQIEGFTEKYGMEYPRAYWDEQVDENMVQRHEAEIFPLMRKRHLFSGVDHFAFYDFVTEAGTVDENVFAYSNRAGDERALIVYNNAYTNTRGRIQMSTAVNLGDAENKDLRRTALSEALALDTRDDHFCVFRDHRAGLEFIRSGSELARDGLAVDLHAYQYNAFLDFRTIHDKDGTWRRLADSMQGGGVPSVGEAYAAMMLEPIHVPFRKVMNAERLEALSCPRTKAVTQDLSGALTEFVEAIRQHIGVELSPREIVDATLAELDVLETFDKRLKRIRPSQETLDSILGAIPSPYAEDLTFWRVPIALALMQQPGRVRAAYDFSPQPAATTDDWLLSRIVAEAFAEDDEDDTSVWQDTLLVKVLATHPTALDFFPAGGGAITMRRMFEDPSVQRFLYLNRHAGSVWFNKEQMERLVYWLLFESVVALARDGALTKTALSARAENAAQILAAADEAGYEAETFFAHLSHEE
ncbi:MAG: alpha-amylase [Nitrospiraceae bacterium]|nr:alpha-amylase [Nitrospiraceae bacterium]